MLFRYMLKELRNGPRFALLFVLNMSLGLLGFISLDALKRNFRDRLQDSAKTLLGADLTMSSRRPITDLEGKMAIDSLPPGSVSQHLTSLFTMMATKDSSSLVEVRAVEEDYPYYGDILLEHLGFHRKAPSLKAEPTLWIAPELAIKLELKQGSEVTIGQQTFKIADTIKEDTATSIGQGMAPRVYMNSRWLAPTGLLVKGNTAWHTILYKLPLGAAVDKQLRQLKLHIPDPSVRIRSYLESGQDNGRMLAYLSDYLGLVALVALSLAGIGAAYLYRDYFERRSSSLAVLISLGLTHNKALLLYLMQVGFLGIISAIFSSLLALGVIPLLLNLVKDFSPVAFEAGLPWQTIAFALVLGGLGSILICLPVLQRLRRLNPSVLFHEQNTDAVVFLSKDRLAYLPVLAAFYGLSVLQAHSLPIGSLFFGLALLILTFFACVAWGFLYAVTRLRRSPSLSLRLAALFLRSHPASTISAFVAIGLGSSLINLIPQLQGSILRELDSPDGRKLPSFFLFDIQDDQVADLKALLATLGSSAQSTSPMIMARLTETNGKTFQRDENKAEGEDKTEGRSASGNAETREAQQEENSRNRGVNLSYRMELARGESIEDGRFFTRPYSGDGIGEVSLEAAYADRLKLKLGDTIKFDVQGLEIEGLVTSLRKVKWNTFEPNFFILLQPGVIDDAPKTFLMNIPEMPIDKKVSTQQAIVKKFPNISVIDVSALVAKITLIVQQMALILNVMAYLTTFTGVLVIYSIAQHQALARRWDHNLLKILGAEFPVLLRASAIEFASTSGIASLLGAGIGLVCSFVIAKVLFKGVWRAQIALPLTLSLGLVAVCLATAMIATLRILRSKPELQIES